MQATNQFLTFFLAGDEYAIPVLKVPEIIECGALTKVPGAPVWVRGVINLRGAVVPVVDLSVKFGQPPTVITRRTCVVIVEIANEDERLRLGVMADSVHRVLEIAPSEILPPPTFGPKVRVDCILGMGNNGDGFVVLLDIDRILSADVLLNLEIAEGVFQQSPLPAAASSPWGEG